MLSTDGDRCSQEKEAVVVGGVRGEPKLTGKNWNTLLGHRHCRHSRVLLQMAIPQWRFMY